MTRNPVSTVFAFAVVAVALAMAPAPVFANDATPSAVVSRFQDSLIGVMQKAKFMSIAERYAQLEGPVEDAFDLQTMTRLAVGRQWAAADAADRNALVAAFKRYNIAYIATLFSGYDGQTFELSDEREARDDVVVVATDFVSRDGSQINISYVTRKRQEGWFVIDVVVDNGISELKVRQSEYRAILDRGGVPELAETLNAKADYLLSQ